MHSKHQTNISTESTQREKEKINMKKRSLTTIILAVAMIAVLGIGGIMAYFTDYEEVTNSFT